MTEAPAIRTCYMRPRPGDEAHPAEIVVVLERQPDEPRRELVHPVPATDRIHWLRSVVDHLFLPEGFKSRPAETPLRQTTDNRR